VIAPRSVAKLRRLKCLRKLLGRALKGADVILGSLTQDLPALGGVREYNEAAEITVDTTCDDVAQ